MWLRVSWERLQYRRTEDPLVDGDVDVSRNQKESEQQVATLEGWGPAGIWNEKVKVQPLAVRGSSIWRVLEAPGMLCRADFREGRRLKAIVTAPQRCVDGPGGPGEGRAMWGPLRR